MEENFRNPTLKNELCYRNVCYLYCNAGMNYSLSRTSIKILLSLYLLFYLLEIWTTLGRELKDPSYTDNQANR